MKHKFIDGFILKVIGLITMTFDHVGVFMERFIPEASEIANIFRCVGRLAFPIFVFLIVEGIRHTKSFAKYILRLGILATILIVGEAIIFYNFDNSLDFPSPINDLVIIALAIYLLNRKDKLSFLSILPIGFSVFCFLIPFIEKSNDITITFLPFFLRCDYDIFGMILAIGYWLAPEAAKLILKSNENTANILTEDNMQTASDICAAFWVIFVSLIMFVINKVTGQEIFFDIIAYASLAAIPILFYNGKRGYNAKWFKYGSYLYFPLHLIIIFLVFVILGYIDVGGYL